MKPVKIVCAGFGGQGVLTIGQLIATMAMEKGYQVSWMPSYGPEMRGGTANCHVVIDEKEVGSPIITEGITHLLALNQPAFDKFYPKVSETGYILFNETLIKPFTSLSGQSQEAYDFASLAQNLGSPKVQNMIALGYLVKAIQLFDEAEALAALNLKFGTKYQELSELNAQALHIAFKDS